MLVIYGLPPVALAVRPMLTAAPWQMARAPRPRRYSIAGLRAPLLDHVAGNLDAIEAASPDTQGILRSHPDLIYALFRASASPPQAKRRKTGN